jgi:hypothetical protein
MYLSRFNKDEEDLPKVKEKSQKAADVEGVSFVETNKTLDSNVSSTTNHDKKRRYALSLATLAAKPAKRFTIVHEGAIPTLIELSQIHDKAIQVRCASAFASLSSEPQLRSRMLDEKALSAIISLATNSNLREVKIDCCKAICNLCCEYGYEVKMVKEGVPFAVTHIAAACPETFDNCLKILLNISCVSDKFTRIEDVTEALMFFVNVLLTFSQEILILSTLCNLSALKGNQLRLVEDGCLRVVEKFYRSPHGNIRRMSCEILKNLTTDTRTRTKLLDLNIISLLMSMSRDPEEEIKMQCLKAFLYLAKDVNFRQQIVHGDAFQLIIKSSLEPHASQEMGQISAKTLRILCGDKDMAPKLVNNGVCGALIKLLESPDEVIHQYCAESFCALLQSQEILESVVSHGADKVMVSLSYQTANPLTNEWCSFALYHLSKSQACSPEAFRDSILPCVVKLCEGSTELTKSFCCGAFASMTLSKVVDCSGAIVLLVLMLRTESSQVIKKFCASALFNLADVDENCYKMLDAEALLPVVELTQSNYMQTKVICAGIISRLSLHKKYYTQFASGNVLKVLLELSLVDHRLTQRRVVIALSNLSQNEELRSKLLEHDPIPYIIALASERDEYLRRGCISIVCNMSYITGSEKAIVQAGIVPRLLITSLITSDQIVSKITCVKALTNLMADATLYKSMVKDGIIWGLSKLAQLDNEELLVLCAKALCRLSYHFAKEMLTSSVAVMTMLRLLDSPLMQLKKAGARTLTNVLLQTTNEDEEFRKHVVLNMIPLARCKDDELNEMSVLCLCLTSQSESCRSAIVESGMLQMIDASTIFSDKKVSYAYITMFSNIANNPLTRTKVLDDLLIDRFQKICLSRDHFLDLAVAKALYCVSCSAENIPKLVDQNIVPFIRAMTEADYDDEGEGGKTANSELTNHLIACLYNLTTCVEVQNSLVSQGFVDVMQSLWSEAEKDFKMCKLAYLSICHLACGKTNSARMVADGCTSMLCFITEYRNMPAYSNYQFNGDVYLRCSAAFRNLLSVVANQKAMVGSGCLDTLIILANSSAKLMSSHVGTNPVSANMRGVRINCAAALKSMTYNKEIRDRLVGSDAINVILSDIRRDYDDLSLSQGLLRELEAESWDNGARGKHKDGRAKQMKPCALYTDFVKGTSNVQLNVGLKEERLDKFCVQVQLDEPDVIELQEAGEGGSGDGMLDLGIGDLTSYEDGEESNLLAASSMGAAYPKEECSHGRENVSVLMRMDSFNEEGVSVGSEDPDSPRLGPSIATNVNGGSFKGGVVADSLGAVGASDRDGNYDEKKAGGFLPNLFALKATQSMSDGSKGSQSPHQTHLPEMSKTQRDKFRQSISAADRKTKADQSFQSLVDMIKHAKHKSGAAPTSNTDRSKGTSRRHGEQQNEAAPGAGALDDVLKKWNTISRF